jgi:hypothetical protein
LDLLEGVFSTCNTDVPPTVTQARSLASALGLGEPGSYPGFRWQVAAHSYADLAPGRLQLPGKHQHSGKFDWVGPEKIDLPKYLWDNVTFATVEATPERLRRYCAVSWTWGRYQKGYATGNPEWRNTRGVDWRVPKLPMVRSPFFRKPVDRLTHLKHLLCHIKAFRYFWVDVLCINQGADTAAEAEKKSEIAKQAQIFANATASIAYLWGLDERDRHDLSRALGALGGLLAACICFRPGQPFLGASHASSVCTFPQHTEWDHLFTRLQDDKWFTSLWALQEMVLFPSAIWMTQDGGLVTVNKHLVTTRLFATAVRLLQNMSKIRAQQWDIEEKWYIRTNNINESRYLKLRKAIDDLEHRRRVALHEESRRQEDHSVETELCIEVSTEPRIPSVLKHKLADQPLQDEVDKWIKWSFGKAGIDVSLGANRTAILIAGSNREVVDNQSKEYALLAALKIGYDRKLVPEDFQDFLECEERHFSHNLLNIILREEGPRMFNVLHESFVPEFKTHSSNMLDVSDWESLPATFPYLEIALPDKPKSQRRNSDHDGDWVQITKRIESLQSEVPYHQNGRGRYVAIPRPRDRILTDMLPWKAAYANYKDSSYDDSVDVVPEDIRNWHIHPSGKVHIPSSAKIQDISTGTKIKLCLNGGEVEYDIYGASDLKLIGATQSWLSEKLGNKPKFIFLPLYTCHFSSRDDVGGQTRGSVKNHHAGNRQETFGVVLVGKSRLRKEQSHTTWYKLGMYSGTGPTTTLGWKDGIVVTSPHDDARISASQFRRECQDLSGVATLFKQSSSDMAAMVEEGLEGIHLTEILRVRSNEPMDPDGAGGNGLRSHFVRYFGWVFGAEL